MSLFSQHSFRIVDSVLFCASLQIFDLHIGKRAATRSVCSSITSLECGMNKFFFYFVENSFWLRRSLHVWVISHIKTIWVGGILFFIFHFWLEAFPILSLVDFHHLHVIILMYWRTNTLDCYKKNGPAFRSFVRVRNKSHFNRLCLCFVQKKRVKRRFM